MKKPSKVTKLPDGSAFCTATIMSEEEAMKLPPEKRPICFRISSEMYHDVFESIGAASMTFNADAGNKVFNSELASKIAIDLCFKIAREVENHKCPDCGSPKRNLDTPKQDPCKPNKNVKAPKFVWSTEGYDPNKLTKN